MREWELPTDTALVWQQYDIDAHIGFAVYALTNPATDLVTCHVRGMILDFGPGVGVDSKEWRYTHVIAVVRGPTLPYVRDECLRIGRDYLLTTFVRREDDL